MDSLAILSDIHGNRWALEAVLADIDRQGVSGVVNLGDVFYGPLDPLGTAEILAKTSFPTVCGNEDRLVAASDAPGSATLDFVRGQLSAEHHAWLRDLPVQREYGDSLMFHGSPSSDTEYLLWDVTDRGAGRRRPLAVAERIGNSASTLILCGHDHVPCTLSLPDGRTVVNPGSVGLPAYWDDFPHDHVMEAGSPHARYSIVYRTDRGWSVTDRAVPYDWGSAAAAAVRNGRDDWAAWLLTGLATAGKPKGG